MQCILIGGFNRYLLNHSSFQLGSASKFLSQLRNLWLGYRPGHGADLVPPWISSWSIADDTPGKIYWPLLHPRLDALCIIAEEIVSRILLLNITGTYADP
jgi:hypothetical protein